MRGDSFIAQRPAGLHWLHVHPEYLVDEECWELVRLASNWREGLLPQTGGVQDQAAFTVASIEIILSAWARLKAAREKSRSKE